MIHLFDDISTRTHLVPFSSTYKIHHFDSGIEEYNNFLKNDAEFYEHQCVSKTHLLLDNYTADIIGYLSLGAAAIKITTEEKTVHDLGKIPFHSIPVLKIGKLAVDKNYRKKQKGYGSYLIEIARGFALELNEVSIGCRFIVVDADVQYSPQTVNFYLKNGFSYSQQFPPKEGQRTVLMLLNLLEDERVLEETGS